MGADRPDEKPLTVNLPDELPVLSQRASRILLEMLIELTDVEVLGGPPEGGDNDC